MTDGRFDGEIAPFGPAAPSRGWGSVPLSFGQSQWFRFDLSETADTFSFLTTWNRDVRVGFSQVFAPDLTVTMFRVVDGVLAPMLGEAGAALESKAPRALAEEIVEQVTGPPSPESPGRARAIELAY